jgi:hypothetical protein
VFAAGVLSLLPSTSLRSRPQLLPLAAGGVAGLTVGGIMPASAVLPCCRLPPLLPLLLPPLTVVVTCARAPDLWAPDLLPSSRCGQLANTRWLLLLSLMMLLLTTAAVGRMGALTLPPALWPCSKLPKLPLLMRVLTNPVGAVRAGMLSQLRSGCSVRLAMLLLLLLLWLLLLLLTAVWGASRAGRLAQLRSGCPTKLLLLLLMVLRAARGLCSSRIKLIMLGLKLNRLLLLVLACWLGTGCAGLLLPLAWGMLYRPLLLLLFWAMGVLSWLC